MTLDMRSDKFNWPTEWLSTENIEHYTTSRNIPQKLLAMFIESGFREDRSSAIFDSACCPFCDDIRLGMMRCRRTTAPHKEYFTIFSNSDEVPVSISVGLASGSRTFCELLIVSWAALNPLSK